MLYGWFLNRLQSIAAAVGLFGSVCALGVTLIAIGVLLVGSLIPFYLSENADEAVGEFYCINNYSITAGFQIPQYSTTFSDTKTSAPYNFQSATGADTTINTVPCPFIYIQIDRIESITVNEGCTYQTISTISPSLPNAKAFDNYALSEACYRTLQTCYYDSLLTSCLLSNCVIANLLNPSGSASYPLTYYTLSCSAKIYYKTRCSDSAASYGLSYSSSQKNSACRQQRLNRINTCLNSTVQLSNMPCLISVSSGLVTYASGTCTQSVTSTSTEFYSPSLTNGGSTEGFLNTNQVLASTFTSTTFSASDQSIGHVYQVSSINSQNYSSTQPGALYCGAVTRTQIASAINAAISSQTSG